MKIRIIFIAILFLLVFTGSIFGQTLTATPSNQNVGNTARSTTFDVTSNIAWTASEDTTWLTLLHLVELAVEH